MNARFGYVDVDGVREAAGPIDDVERTVELARRLAQGKADTKGTPVEWAVAHRSAENPETPVPWSSWSGIERPDPRDRAPFVAVGRWPDDAWWDRLAVSGSCYSCHDTGRTP